MADRTCGDIFAAENANFDITVDVPFLTLAVWLAAVIDEASEIALRTSINDSTHAQTTAASNYSARHPGRYGAASC